MKVRLIWESDFKGPIMLYIQC